MIKLMLLLAVGVAGAASWLFVPTTASGSFSTKSIDYRSGGGRQITTTSSISIDFNEVWAVCAWVYITDMSTINIIFDNQTSANNFRGEFIFVDAAGKITYAMENQDGPNAVRIRTTSAVVSANTWYHLCGSMDGTGLAAGAAIWLNGVSQTVTTLRLAASASTVSATPVFLGMFTDGVSFPLVGYMDEFAIWKGAASPQTSGDFLALYNSGSPTNLATGGSASALLLWYRLGESPDTITTFVDRAGSNDGIGSNFSSGDITTFVP